MIRTNNIKLAITQSQPNLSGNMKDGDGPIQGQKTLQKMSINPWGFGKHKYEKNAIHSAFEISSDSF